MTVPIQAYWQKVREGVCTQCLDGDDAGHCRIDPVWECPLQMYFSQIVGVVRQLRSGMADPVREVRSIVCGYCQYQTGSGNCRLHEEIECPLDRHLAEVVRIIGECEKRTVESRKPGGSFTG